MITNAQVLVATMTQNQADLDKLKSDLARCQGIVSAASSQGAGIAALKAKRSQEVANALIDQRPADIAEIDAEIVKLQKAAAKVQSDSEAAAAGIPILQGRIAAATALLADTRSQLADAYTQDIVAQHDLALEKYFAAVDSLSQAVEEIVACEKTWRHVLNPRMQTKFPGRGVAVLHDIRSGGLRVRWDRSMLRDPEVAAGYLPGYESTYFVPWWADERNTQFAEALVTANVQNLQAAGYPAADYPVLGRSNPGSASGAIAKSKTVVEVIRGTVHRASHLIDSATGKNVLVKDKHYGPGESFALEESEAADLVVSGFVKYVDGRTKEDAFELLYPGQPIPSELSALYSTGPATSKDDQPRASFKYEGQSGDPSRAINGLPSGDLKISQG